MNCWECIPFSAEAIRRLSDEGKDLDYCDLIIETRWEYDDYNHVHYYYQVITSTGEYQGRYDEHPYSWLCAALRRDGWLGPYQLWQVGPVQTAVVNSRQEIWIGFRAQLRPGDPARGHRPGVRHLAGADLRRAVLPQDLQGANLEGANLDRADLGGRDLKGAILRLASAVGANLAGSYLDMADLSHADLRGANLTAISMEGAVFDGANLTGAVLQLADGQGASFRGANLRGARLRRIQARSACFAHADLTHADLRGAVLVNADLTGAQLVEADVLGACFWA